MTTRPLTDIASTSLLVALMLVIPLAHSQPVCSSDAQAAPTALFERFINADCESCWSDANTPVAPPGTLALGGSGRL